MLHTEVGAQSGKTYYLYPFSYRAIQENYTFQDDHAEEEE